MKAEIREIGRPRMLFLTYVSLGHLFVHWYVSLLAFLLPSIKADFGLSNTLTGTITTTQNGVAQGTTLATGYLSDTFRKQGALIVASAVLSLGIGYFIIGSANHFAWILVGVGITGVGIALWHPGAMGALSLNFPGRRGFALSIHGVAASIGDTIAPVIVGTAIIGALMVSWETTMRFHLIPAIVAAFLVWKGLGLMRVGPAQRPTFRSYVTGIKQLFADRQAIVVLASNALISGARLVILSFLPIYIKEDLGYSDGILGVYITLLAVMGIVSQPIMGLVSDKYGRKSVMLPAFAILGVLYISLVYVGGGIPLGIIVVLLGAFIYAILNIAQAAIMDVAGEGVQSSSMGVMGLVSYPITFGAPILAGFFADAYGIHSAFWFAGVAALLAAAVLIPIRFRKLGAT